MEWRDIKGYEGYYQVSDTGLVRSLDRIITRSDGRKHLLRGKVKKERKDKHGYPRVVLNVSNKPVDFYIHRLVAETFIPNPNNLPQVNHKDENPSNNCLSNLEWCDGKYNVRYSVAVKVKQYDLDGNLIKVWDCIQDISSELGIPTSNIVLCCKKKQKSAGGFCWNYASDDVFSNEVCLTEEERNRRNKDNHDRYYKDHAATLEYKRQWYIKNCDKIQSYSKKWYQKHCEEIRARVRERYRAKKQLSQQTNNNS